MVRSNKYCRQVIFAMSTTICACASSAPEMPTTPTIAAAATSHVLNDLCDSDLADICSLRILPQSNHDSIGYLSQSYSSSDFGSPHLEQGEVRYQDPSQERCQAHG